MAAPTIEQTQGSAATAELHLVVVGPGVHSTHPLPVEGVLLVGRAEDADVRVPDPLVSRNHVRMHLGPNLAVEDLDSANGTWVHSERIEAGRRVGLTAGDAVLIGSTMITVQRREPRRREHQLWSHGHFENRLIEECARAATHGAPLAVLRLDVGAGENQQAEDALANEIRPGDVLASYGPSQYDLLLVDSDAPAAQALAARILQALERKGLSVRHGLALWPADGSSPGELVARACERARVRAGADPGESSVVVLEPAMRELYALAERVAAGSINVLILGETGVGKEVLAETVHRKSPRATGPFLSLNCAALSESLLESELFGHERGAFTGATQSKTGLLEAASGGSLFLDEIGEMPLAMQAKMLRVLETRQVLRVGATRPRPIDVRVIAATNRNLEEDVANRAFRQDLFFRIGGVTLSIPPLRERLAEIEPIARLVATSVATQLGRPVPGIASPALALLRDYPWPGNIRELRNVIERAVLLATGPEITVAELPVEKMRRSIAAGVDTSSPNETVADAASLLWRDRRAEVEREAIIGALNRCSGNQSRAAELLGMPRSSFLGRMKKYRIESP